MKAKTLSNTLDIDKCAALIGSRFELVLIAAHRARELKRGYRKLVDTPNGVCVSALQEVEAGLIGREYLKKI